MANTGLLYWKQYYVEETESFKERNTAIYQHNIKPIERVPSGNVECRSADFKLTTTYPGLLTGSGYVHEVYGDFFNNIDYDQALKLGMYFDFLSGMPVIPGSSIKGVIRSMFPNRFKLTKGGNQERQTFKEIQEGKMRALNNWAHKNIDRELNESEWSQLEEEIFSGRCYGTDCQRSYRPFSQRDIFFDAVPLEMIENYRTGECTESRLLGDDYTTPHKHDSNPELDPFTNPKPIHWMKVMPGVTYEFRFRLVDSKCCPEFTRDQKKILFQYIIELIGVGAKTNVGYGRMVKNYRVRDLATARSLSYQNEIADPTVYWNGKRIMAVVGPIVDDLVAFAIVESNDVLYKKERAIRKKWNEMANRGSPEGQAGAHTELTEGMTVELLIQKDFSADPRSHAFTVLPQ